MKVFRLTIAGALLLTVVTAALGMSVKLDYQKNFDFSQLRTFAFKTDWTTDDPLSTNTLEAERLQNALAAQLEANGFTPSSDNQDFIVAFYSRTREKTQVQSTGGFRPGPHFGFGRGLVGAMGSLIAPAGAGAMDPTSGPLITRKDASWLTLSTPALESWCGAAR